VCIGDYRKIENGVGALQNLMETLQGFRREWRLSLLWQEDRSLNY
jgi:hypothetical protein